MDIDKLHARERRVADDIAQGLASRARMNKQRPFSRPKRDDVRVSILNAAADVFLDEGYERASLARIATRAGFTKGAIYSNFGSKTALFMEVWEEQVRQNAVVETLTELANDANDVDDLLDRLSSALTDYIPTLQPWEILIAQVRMLARTNPEVASIYKRVFDERIEKVVEATRQHPSMKHLSEKQLRIFAIALISLMNSLCLERAAHPDFQSNEESTNFFRYCLQGVIA
ncbi:MAG: TetR/AcrR family transcriptional regulator [Actinomycetaceae bacterium]|nr:TetR/AcrR family transcriptional regulator [Actinomycetaceae bacterium]